MRISPTFEIAFEFPRSISRDIEKCRNPFWSQTKIKRYPEKEALTT
jgi:hypothetical protein